MRRYLWLAVVFWPCLAMAGKPTVDYARDIKPILRERCYACHGALQQKNGLRLDTAELLKKGGAGGPGIEVGKSAESLLVLAVTGAEGTLKMPPEGEGTALTAEQIALVKQWIDQGAVAPPERIPEDPKHHWAFRKVVRPAVPKVKHAEWVSNPVDAFLVSEWERRGLAPAPAADKGVLLRRVYVDLIGLPPSRAELHEFLDDSSPDAYEKVVDRLLASPQHAERWGRHWMDVWRYSDWYGRREINEQRNGRRHIWRWRDWIVEALQADKGYDQMLREMLAADELAPTDLNAQRASGYLGRNYYLFNRSVWMQDTVEHVGMGFLGLTLKCCRCHDHKYDPIAQAEYYRIRNIFEPHQARTDRIPGKPEEFSTGAPQDKQLIAPGGMLKDGYDCIYEIEPQAVTYLLRRGNDKDPDKSQPMTAGVPAVLGGELSIKPVELPLESFYPALRPDLREDVLKEARREIEKVQKELVKSTGQDKVVDELRLSAAKAKLDSLEARFAAELAKYRRPQDPKFAELAAVAARKERTVTLLVARADLAAAERNYAVAKAELRPVVASTLQQFQKCEKGLEAARKALLVAEKLQLDKSNDYTAIGRVFPTVSSGRRTAFAHWLTRPENPLTARVAVNHIWARHFGVGIVPTLHNFGLNGKRPSHPELLDWLASEFVSPTSGADASSSGGWQMKHLHRLLVTSQAYRRSSTELATDDRNLQIDPENRFLWRMNPRRMEAEVVRDSLLALAGSLDLARGGPDIDPVKADQVPRRSLYFTICPDTRALMLEQFDAANPLECYIRTESIIPQQALALANGSLSFSQTRLMARTLSQVDGAPVSPSIQPNAKKSEIGKVSDAEFIARSYELILCRAPNPDERDRCLAFLKHQPQLLANRSKLTPFTSGDVATVKPSDDAAQRARENLVHVLLNSNEFVTVK